MSGTPLVAGDRIYATAFKTESNTELHLLAIGASDGRLIWSTQLGNSQVDQSQMYYRRTAQPSVLKFGDVVYVDTQTGGLTAVGADKGELRWGFNYDAEAPSTEYWNNPNVGLETCSPPVLHNGILYVKGMRSTRLCAIDLAETRMVWERPVSKSAVILSIEGRRMLLGGDELTMLDLEQQKLVWATRLPLATGWTRAAVTQNRVYQFTPRGIFILDKETGDRVGLARGADLDSLGGVVMLSPHGLVTVSNLAVTCYPLRKPATPDHAEADATNGNGE
jgi:outer membrane protein assembly factor BamB